MPVKRQKRPQAFFRNAQNLSPPVRPRSDQNPLNQKERHGNAFGQNKNVLPARNSRNIARIGPIANLYEQKIQLKELASKIESRGRLLPSRSPLSDLLQDQAEELLELFKEHEKKLLRFRPQIQKASIFVLRQQLESAILRGEIKSFVDLREELANIATEQGIQVTPQNEQAIIDDFLLKLFSKKELKKMNELFETHNRIFKAKTGTDIIHDTQSSIKRAQTHSSQMAA